MSKSNEKSETDSLWDNIGIDGEEISLMALIVFLGFWFDIIIFESAVIAMLGIIAIAAAFSGKKSGESPMNKFKQFDDDGER